jgi:hypothetical protein
MLKGNGYARLHKSKIKNQERTKASSIKAKDSPSNCRSSPSANQTNEAKGNAFWLKRQLNRNLVPYRQFEKQHTDLKTKTQQHRPDHTPHVVRLAHSRIVCSV